MAPGRTPHERPMTQSTAPPPGQASLTDLATSPGFRLRTRERVWTLPDLVAAGVTLAPSLPTGDGLVLEIPAIHPVETLVYLEAAFGRGFIPVPSTRARTARALTVPRDIAGSLAPRSGADPTRGLCEQFPSAALGIHTSGSTGAPRLPVFTWAAVVTSAGRIARYLKLGPADELALLQPLDHGFGLVGQLFAAIAAGAGVTDCASPYPGERAAAIANARANVVAAVPHALLELAEHLPDLDPEAARRLRSVGSAGGRLPPAGARRLALAFPEAVIWNQYGCTEAGPRLTAVPSTHPVFYTATVGRAIEGVRLWIASPGGGEVLAAGRPGEICFASDTQMLGYLGNPAATAQHRRAHGELHGFWTGDLGVLDPYDRLHVLGRADDLVKVRGERVSLDAVARAAEAAGARAAIAVLVEPALEAADGHLALVYEGDAVLTPAAIAQALPGQMGPRRLLWVPKLPRLPSGKIDRSAVESLARVACGLGA